MKHILIIITPIALLLNIISISLDLKSQPNFSHIEIVEIPGCEFKLFFPTQIKKKEVFAEGVEFVVVESVYDGDSPYLRAECFSISAQDRKLLIDNFRQNLQNTANLAGISNTEYSIETTNLGLVGTYSGLRMMGGYRGRLFGKLIIGENSMLALLISELANEFPSDKTTYFLNRIEKK